MKHWKIKKISKIESAVQFSEYQNKNNENFGALFKFLEKMDRKMDSNMEKMDSKISQIERSLRKIEDDLVNVKQSTDKIEFTVTRLAN
jgi:septal ring factor EnvC (AmiA/AmiB activator)